MEMDLHVIVRAAGERTADYCCKELARQTSDDLVERIELSPFWRTLREGLERGLKSGAAWVMMCDADIIPSPDAVTHVRGWIKEADAKVGVLSGMVQDKLFGGIRFGGIRLYRASVIPDMLELMPPEGETVRPESSALHRLAERGWRHETVTELVGLHDYEQYYRDIYRKAFLHMQKHDYVAERFIPLWKKLAANDVDYRVALGGAASAILELGDVDCDVSHSAYRPEEVLQRLSLEEKDTLNLDQCIYEEKIMLLQESHDSGEISPVSLSIQNEYDYAMPEAQTVRRINRLGRNLKQFAEISSEARKAALHQVRRALPDQTILDTFSIGELAFYGIGRIRRAFIR